MYKMLNVLPIFFLLVPIVNAANILVFWPLPIPSHFNGFEPLFTELAYRGHNVTVVSHYPKSIPIANYTDIIIANKTVTNQTIKVDPLKLLKYNIFQLIQTGWTINKMYSESVLPIKSLQDFILSEAYIFDLVLVESFFQEYTVTMGHKFNAPVILITPTTIQPTNSHWIGLPSTFSYILDIRSHSSDHKTFYERLKSTFIGIVQIYLEEYTYIPKQTQLMNKYFKYENYESRPSLNEMLANVSLTLVQQDLSIGAPRPYLPGVVEIGGLHIKEPKKLPKNLEKFIESAKNGIIFISFGTYIHPCVFSKQVLDSFVSVIQNLKQKVLWRWGCSSPPPNLPADNVMYNKWFPQFDILGHPNTKLFITHGGLHSVEESTYNAVPMVGVPFFADQFSNLKLVEKKGYGKLIEFFKITENSLHSTIDEVLNNPMYKRTAITYSEIYKDGFLKPMDKAIYWIEYVLRNNGASHLKSYSIQLNSVQYFLVDIIVILLILVIILIYLFLKTMSIIKQYLL